MGKIKKYYVEGYGCAFNLAETNQIKTLFDENNFSRTNFPKKADILLVNTCAVKDTTEKRMLFRLKSLYEQKKPLAKLFAFGCLAATRKKTIQKINSEIIVLGTDLKALCHALDFETKSFSPKTQCESSSKLVSIIPISTGCVGNCTYCATKLARGDLSSYSVKLINQSFSKIAKNGGEIWLTSQDLGCYGFDIKKDICSLLKILLKNDGDYLIRLGMMNPNHFFSKKEEIMEIFDNPKVFKFLHLPLQSGSDKILKKMNRKYSVKEFVSGVSFARKMFPQITIATDIIVGFPGETKKDFQDTIKIIKKTLPDVINISRYSKRPQTVAAKMEFQLTESEKKDRSRILTKLKNNLLIEKNKQLIGKEFEIFVSEKKVDGTFVGRNINYRPIVVSLGFGKKIKVKIMKAYSNFFVGEGIS
jgi:threonylcarbamoyladenosine tRNA methylthiotransferase CDKAL1